MSDLDTVYKESGPPASKIRSRRRRRARNLVDCVQMSDLDTVYSRLACRLCPDVR